MNVLLFSNFLVFLSCKYSFRSTIPYAALKCILASHELFQVEVECLTKRFDRKKAEPKKSIKNLRHWESSLFYVHTLLYAAQF